MIHIDICIIRTMPPRIANRWITQEESDAAFYGEDSPVRQLVYDSAFAVTIGLAVLKYRHTHDLSQTVLAKRVGMSQSQVARLEIGEHSPTIGTLLRLCDVLGLELSLTIGPKQQERRTVPSEPRGCVAHATDQLTISITETAPAHAADSTKRILEEDASA